MLRIRRFGKNRCGIIFVMHPLFEKADALTGEVIEAAIEVQKHFGIGLLENIYKQALAQEMRVRGQKVNMNDHASGQGTHGTPSAHPLRQGCDERRLYRVSVRGIRQGVWKWRLFSSRTGICPFRP